MNLNDVIILLVEDNPNDVELILRALKKSTDKFHVVTDGAEALKFIFATGKYAQRNIKNPRALFYLT